VIFKDTYPNPFQCIFFLFQSLTINRKNLHFDHHPQDDFVDLLSSGSPNEKADLPYSADVAASEIPASEEWAYF
jgi:hypothetical protein